MPTTISYGPIGNQQHVTFVHPRELSQKYPAPPGQPVASWAAELAEFEALCTAGVTVPTNFATARATLLANCMFAVIADVPGGAAAAIKEWISQQYGTGGRELPPCFGGAKSSWLP